MNEQRDKAGIKRNWPMYEVESVLGHGAYGQVYKIKREYLGNTTYSALKVIHIPPNDDMRYEMKSWGMTEKKIKEYYKELVQNFLNENSVMEKLKGASNIVTVEDCMVEKDEEGDGYTIYIKMELLESLDFLMMNYKLGPDDIVTVGRDICDALTACEQMNIIHRDIKPANVFINSFGTFKLGDFGVAKQMQHTQTGMTQIGTAMYMAPELYRGEKADKRVDIYSLGIMLYRIANEGCFPFVDPDTINPASNQDALLKRLKGEELPLPAQVDKELGQIIIKACAHKADERYASAKELKDALTAWNVKQKCSKEILDDDKRKEEEEKRKREEERKENEEKQRIKELEKELARLKKKEAEEEYRKKQEVERKRKEEEQRRQKERANNGIQNTAGNVPKKKSKAMPVVLALLAICIVVAIVLSSQSRHGTTTEANKASNEGSQIPENTEVGDTVEMGTYNNASIEWQVLDKEEDKALLISKNCLLNKPYNEEYESVTWEICTLRDWLNNDFYNGSFTEEEQNKIMETTLTNPDNPEYGTKGGNDTKDKVFLLSIEEAEEYFLSDEERKATYADGSWAWWWLRSPGYDVIIAARVDNDGNVCRRGSSVTSGNNAVRPALWVNLDSDTF